MSEPSLPLVEPLGDRADPAEICSRFLDLPYLVFLDSASVRSSGGDAQQMQQYSFLAADPSSVVRSKGLRTEVRDRADHGWRPVSGDALSAARGLLPPLTTPTTPDLPPFQGGLAGYIGYDWAAVLERLPRCRYDDLHICDVVLGLYDWVIAWDHRQGAAWIISTGMPLAGGAQAHRAGERMAMVRERLGGRRGSGKESRLPVDRPCGDSAEGAHSRAPSYPVTGIPGGDIGLRSTFTHRGYLDTVQRVREYIVAGDIFQANLSQRFEGALPEPPFELYRRLRQRTPAPIAAYLDFDDLQILSASPERFLRLDPERRVVETRPIKGTRPRGLGPMHDAALGRALAESQKDRAENVMIVDLLRNDLSRSCRLGSVRVPRLFDVESFATVHHLVSTVTGELDAGYDAIDLLRGAFPGGSITGAPKLRAMQIIEELEPHRRGVYCGAIGYLGFDGTMDLNIAIRTMVLSRGEIRFWAGGGIVADSNVDDEYQETFDKAAAMLKLLSLSAQRSASV